MAAARPSDLARLLSTSSRDPTGHGRSTAATGVPDSCGTPVQRGPTARPVKSLPHRITPHRAPCDGPSVETELVALDVLHHEARLVVVIGKQ
jgi:hypothetical protein